MEGAHTAAGIALPPRKRFLRTAHGSVLEAVPEAVPEAAATREAADARTAAIAARRAMAGVWNERRGGKRKTERNKEREGGRGREREDKMRGKNARHKERADTTSRRDIYEVQ